MGNLNSRYLTVYANASAPQMDEKRKGRVHFSTTWVSEIYSRSLAFTDYLWLLPLLRASEVPMTFGNLLSCRDMTLNETCHEAEGQGQVAWTSHGPGMLLFRALSLSPWPP